MRPAYAVLLILLLVLLRTATAQAQTPFVPNVSHPLLRDLVSWWRGTPGFTGASLWYDLGVSRNHGTLTSMGYSTTTGWSGGTRPFTTAQVNFDGTDDVVSIGTQTIYDFVNTTFTVDVWFRSTASAGSYLVAKRKPTGGYFLRLNAAGTLSARVVDTNDTSAGERTTVTASLLDGTWYHVLVVLTTDTATLANNDVTMYLNGRLDQGGLTQTGGATYGACACSLVIGAQSDLAAGTFVTGSIDQVRIWSRGLTATDAAELYRLGRGGDVGLAVPSRDGIPPPSVAALSQGSFFPFFGR